MADPCEKTKGWTFETVRLMLEAADKRYEQRFAAQERALEKAESNRHHFWIYLLSGAAFAGSMVGLWLRH